MPDRCPPTRFSASQFHQNLISRENCVYKNWITRIRSSPSEKKEEKWTEGGSSFQLSRTDSHLIPPSLYRFSILSVFPHPLPQPHSLQNDDRGNWETKFVKCGNRGFAAEIVFRRPEWSTPNRTLD